MKKVFCTAACLVLCLALFSGCGKDKEPDYFDLGYTATENGRYSEALENFKKAAENGDEQAQKAADIVSGYLNAGEAADLGNMDSAKEFLNKIPSDYRFYPIADDVNALRIRVYGSAADNSGAEQKKDADRASADKILNETEALIDNGYTDLADKKLSAVDYSVLDDGQKNRYKKLEKSLAEIDSHDSDADQHNNMDEKDKKGDDFTSDKAISYLKQKYHTEGDIGENLTPSYDENGNKYYEIKIQTGSGDDIKILTLRIFGDGTVKEIK